jgi:hypothetical protein
MENRCSMIPPLLEKQCPAFVGVAGEKERGVTNK